jgi:hypothetical protein
MLEKELRKDLIPRKNFRWWLAPAALIITFLPFGAGHTVLGGHSFQVAVTWCGLTLIIGALLWEFIPQLATFSPLRRIHHRIGQLLFKSSEWTYSLAIFLVPLAAAYLCGQVLSGGWPYVADSIAQFAHSRLLTMGMFSAPGHPYPEFFPMLHVIHAERWYSVYQLGHLLPLAVGHWIGMLPLINPLLCGLSALLLYRIARDHYSFDTARISGALAAFCPLWWFMASEYMNHNTTLFAVLLFTWAWLRALRAGALAYALTAGAGLGLAVITRPVTAGAIALPFILHGLWRLRRQPLSHWLTMSCAGIVCLLLIAWQLYFNRQTTGDWFLFGPEALYGKQVSIGFGHVIIAAKEFTFYAGKSHGLLDGIGQASNNLVGLNAYLFNWPVPSLIFVFLGLMIFRPALITALMIASWITLTIAYIPYFFQDWCIGPRYQYEITGFLIITTAIGIVRTPATLRALGYSTKRATITRYLAVALSIFYLGSVGLSSIMMHGLTYCGGDLKVSAGAIDAQIPDQSLVLANTSYTWLGVFLPPMDGNRVIYAKDLKEKNKILMDYYPDRSIYIETPGGFKRIREPLKK